MLANDLVAFGSYAQERADEYIEAIMQRVEKQTEKRIIKLLEEANSSKTHSTSNGCGLCQAIELVKGRNE